MTAHRAFITSILILLTIGFTMKTAQAAFDWNTGAGITWAYGAVGTTPPDSGRDIDKIGVGVDNSQLVLRMYLAGAPTATDAGTVYSILLGESLPPTDYSVESLLRKNRGLLAYYYLQGSTSLPLASNGFNTFDGGKTLEWRVDRGTLNDSFYLYGATTDATGDTIYDHTQLSPTPIPAAFWLLGSGIIGLIGIRRRSQKVPA